MEKNKFSLKKLLFGKISRKLLLVFMVVVILIFILGIFSSEIDKGALHGIVDSEYAPFVGQAMILIFIAISFILIEFFVSRSISKPIKQLHEATEEIEKGNYDVKVDIKTGDELEELGKAFNETTAKLEKVEEEHKQINKAKTKFLTITSHELRSPMTPMKAQLQMLEGEYFGKLNEKQKESIRIVLNNSKRLDKIVVDFLEVSRIETARLKFNFVKTNLTKTIQNLVQYMKGYMPEKNVHFVTKIDELPKIKVDPDRTMQVLRNLINNAIKFSGGNPMVEVTAKTEGSSILFSVKDNGIGISDEDQKRIFDPFFQADKSFSRRFPGTGLGLAICKGIVEAQNGKIWIESKLDEGSTFYFTVPFEPTKKMKPIMVLFSPHELLEKKIEKTFREIQGPIGVPWFKKLKARNEITEEKLYKYIDSIVQQGSLKHSKGALFKERIKAIFKEESNQA